MWDSSKFSIENRRKLEKSNPFEKISNVHNDASFGARILLMAKSSLETSRPYILFIFVNYFRYLDIYYFRSRFVIVKSRWALIVRF